VSAEDIIEFTLDGEAVNASGRKVYLERFIHGEIYRRRPDVQAVVHSHSHAIVPLSVVKGVKLSGFVAWALWLGIHIAYLIGFQNRLIVLTRWTFSYFTRGRGARVIQGS